MKVFVNINILMKIVNKISFQNRYARRNLFYFKIKKSIFNIIYLQSTVVYYTNLFLFFRSPMFVLEIYSS